MLPRCRGLRPLRPPRLPSPDSTPISVDLLHQHVVIFQCRSLTAWSYALGLFSCSLSSESLAYRLHHYPNSPKDKSRHTNTNSPSKKKTKHRKNNSIAI